jgi:hypothetical protein
MQKNKAVSKPRRLFNFLLRPGLLHQQRFRADLFNTKIKELEHDKLYSSYLLFNRGALAKAFANPMAK